MSKIFQLKCSAKSKVYIFYSSFYQWYVFLEDMEKNTHNWQKQTIATKIFYGWLTWSLDTQSVSNMNYCCQKRYFSEHMCDSFSDSTVAFEFSITDYCETK